MSQFTIEETAKAVHNFADMGLSILEISHRSKQFQAVMDETVLQGVARNSGRIQCPVPRWRRKSSVRNGADEYAFKKAAYLDTGVWASKAIKEAKLFGDVDIVASSKDKNYTYIPKDFVVPADVDYFHYTSNNTIYGTELRKDPEVGARLIADMSSDIFSRPVDISKYDLIYGGAQKNLAPSGVTFVIVKDDALSHVDKPNTDNA